MNEIINVLKSKQFLIGLGVGIAGIYVYNNYMRKENTSSASGKVTTGESRDCISKEQLACLTSDDTKKQMIAILQRCGLSQAQIQNYLSECKRTLLNKACK